MRAEHRSKELGTPGKQHEGQAGAGTNTRWSVEGSAAGDTVLSKNEMKIKTGDTVGTTPMPKRGKNAAWTRC